MIWISVTNINDTSLTSLIIKYPGVTNIINMIFLALNMGIGGYISNYAWYSWTHLSAITIPCHCVCVKLFFDKLIDNNWAAFKIPFDLLRKIQSLRRSLRSLTFSKVLLTAQQLQRTSLRISYGKLSRQTKEWSFSERHVLTKKYHSSPGVTEGNLRLRLAYGLLTPSLRQFPISDSDSVNFGLMFKQYREESSIRSGLLSLYAMA